MKYLLIRPLCVLAGWLNPIAYIGNYCKCINNIRVREILSNRMRICRGISYLRRYYARGENTCWLMC